MAGTRWKSKPTPLSAEQLELRLCLTLGVTTQTILVSDFDEVGTRAMEVVDLNGDGALDVLSASAESDSKGRVSWYPGYGDGRFGQQNVITPTSAIDVVPADMDGDGDLDVVALTIAGVAWHENVRGDFAAESEEISNRFAQLVAAADFNQDGRVDIIAGSPSGLTLFQNDGDGTFSPSQLATEGATAIHLADLDDDLLTDVVIGFRGGRVAVLWNEGPRSDNGVEFLLETVATKERNINVLTSSDIDDDGDLDIFVTESDKLSLLSNESGVFTEQYELEVRPIGEPGRIRSVDFADLDQDGALDIVYALDETNPFSNDAILWYPNFEGDGIVEQAFAIAAGFEAGFLMQVADLDDDGLPEIVSAGKSRSFEPALKGDLGFHRIDNELTVAFEPKRPIAVQGGGATALDWSDLDGDGDNDLLTTSVFDRRITWHENLGDGAFGLAEVIDTKPWARSVQTADLEEDDDLDLVVATRIGTYVYYNAGEEDGRLQFEAEQIDEEIALYAEFGDVDGDGDPDVLLQAARTEGNTRFIELLVYPDDQFGFDIPFEVAIHTEVDLGGGLSDQSEHYSVGAPSFIDFDGDGDLDVVQPDSDKIVLFENLGGLFRHKDTIEHRVDVAAFPLGKPLRPIDFDNDGDSDLVYEGTWATTFENLDGNGSFTANTLAFEFGADATTVVDIDDDNDLDVFALNYTDVEGSSAGRLVWFENSGGDFSEPQILVEDDGSAYNIARILAVDVDADGDRDLVTGYHNGVQSEIGGIEWHAVDLNAEAIPKDALAGDVNGDRQVNFADFLLISTNFGKPNLDREDGDLDGNGTVDFADFLLVSTNFGQSSS